MFIKTNLLDVPYGTIFETEVGTFFKIVRIDKGEFGDYKCPDFITLKNIRTRELSTRTIQSEKDLFMTIDQDVNDKIGKILVIAGPSGVGKSNLERDLIELYPVLL